MSAHKVDPRSLVTVEWHRTDPRCARVQITVRWPDGVRGNASATRAAAQDRHLLRRLAFEALPGDVDAARLVVSALGRKGRRLDFWESDLDAAAWRTEMRRERASRAVHMFTRSPADRETGEMLVRAGIRAAFVVTGAQLTPDLETAAYDAAARSLVDALK